MAPQPELHGVSGSGVFLAEPNNCRYRTDTAGLTDSIPVVKRVPVALSHRKKPGSHTGRHRRLSNSATFSKRAASEGTLSRNRRNAGSRTQKEILDKS
ncbi:consensus disorder prediction [Desulfoluna spongiiphila]|nr:consensus disorder prediction [Desulfoluna spongiiphila]